MILTGHEIALSGGRVGTERGPGMGGPAKQPESPCPGALAPSAPFTSVLTARLTEGADSGPVLFQVKTGLMMNIIGVFCVFLAVNTWGRVIFDLDDFPDWANVTHIET